MMVSNRIQELFCEQPVWLSVNDRSGLERHTNGCQGIESAHRKCLTEDAYWRYFVYHQQREEKKGHIKKSHKQKFFLCDDTDLQEELDQDLEEDKCSSSLLSPIDEGYYGHQDYTISGSNKESSLIIKKARHQLSSDIDKPVSLLSQMIQNQPKVQDQERLSLKRCQSRYQSLNEWFVTSL
ncbi:hypothetical protein BD560DRAFT_396916 [Blakeslea trispora]|nr:hypothetical protein BD560DRAFT_396916 [Blakeslea trispora]